MAGQELVPFFGREVLLSECLHNSVKDGSWGHFNQFKDKESDYSEDYCTIPIGTVLLTLSFERQLEAARVAWEIENGDRTFGQTDCGDDDVASSLSVKAEDRAGD